MDQNCAYCMENELLDVFGIKICELEASKVYFFKEQSHKGRVIVASKLHVKDLMDLPEDVRNTYMGEVVKVARVIEKLYHPDKINYGAFGDSSPHLHFHVVPKYKDEFEWNTTFAMNPGKVQWKPEEYESAIAAIKKELQA